MNRFLGILVVLLCVESNADSTLYRHSERSVSEAKNPRIASESYLDSSLTAFAQNDEMVAESTRDSANPNEFIISYRAIMKNNVLIGEEFKIAKALTTSPNPTIIAQCDIIEFSPDDSHIKTLKQNQSAILECIERELKSKIRDDVKSINNEVRTKTTYKIPAQRILLDRQRSKIHIIGQR